MLKNNPYMKAYLNIINEDINVEKCQQIAKIIGGEYDVETNTIDCKGNKVRFKNYWLNDDGSFDFKLVNTSNDWSYMFSKCSNLTHLPEEFIIPDSVMNCKGMFFVCDQLTHLLDNFTIPNSVTNSESMFGGCESLTHLPDNFTIPESVENCSGMFSCCKSLTGLPDNFTIPNNVKDCSYMFYDCESLIKLPNIFSIPINAECENIFTGCNKLENKNPETYKMWEI